MSTCLCRTGWGTALRGDAGAWCFCLFRKGDKGTRERSLELQLEGLRLDLQKEKHEGALIEHDIGCNRTFQNFLSSRAGKNPTNASVWDRRCLP